MLIAFSITILPASFVPCSQKNSNCSTNLMDTSSLRRHCFFLRGYSLFPRFFSPIPKPQNYLRFHVNLRQWYPFSYPICVLHPIFFQILRVCLINKFPFFSWFSNSGLSSLLPPTKSLTLPYISPLRINRTHYQLPICSVYKSWNEDYCWGKISFI